MKYKLLQDLPFMEAGSIFGTGSWVSGGYGIDMGTTRYKGGGTSHNGVKTFNKNQNTLLKSIINDEKWIEHIPESIYDYLDLYDSKKLTAIDLARALLVSETAKDKH